MILGFVAYGCSSSSLQRNAGQLPLDAAAADGAIPPGGFITGDVDGVTIRGDQIIANVTGAGPCAGGSVSASSNIEGLANDRGDGAVTTAKKWLKQADIDGRARKRIASKLTALIRAYDGAPAKAKEILRGFVAARQMGMNLRPFEDRLARKRKAFARVA